MSFYTNILHYYDRLFPLDEAKLKFVKRDLTAHTKQTILDIGCATGALCHALHHDGHQVVGIDIDRAIIDQARGKSEDGPKFEAYDMLTIDRHFEADFFDQILCFDNTLAHLPNEMAVKRFFTAIAKILKKDGVLKLEVVNYDHVLTHGILELPPVQVDGILLKRHQCLEQQCMACYTDLTVPQEDGDDTHYTGCVPLFPIRSSQIVELLEEAGFSCFSHYSDFSGDTRTEDAIYHVIEATLS